MSLFAQIASILAALGTGGVIVHFLKISQYKANAAADWQKVYNDTVTFINNQLEAERKACNDKIAEQNEKIERIEKEMQIVKMRCKNNCFDDAA